MELCQRYRVPAFRSDIKQGMGRQCNTRSVAMRVMKFSDCGDQSDRHDLVLTLKFVVHEMSLSSSLLLVQNAIVLGLVV